MLASGEGAHMLIESKENIHSLQNIQGFSAPDIARLCNNFWYTVVSLFLPNNPKEENI